MKKVLNSFLFYLIIGIILSIFVILKVYIIKYKSVYQDKVYTLTGKVSKVILSEKKVSFVLKEKENIQMFYYDDFDLNDGDKTIENDTKFTMSTKDLSMIKYFVSSNSQPAFSRSKSSKNSKS